MTIPGPVQAYAKASQAGLQTRKAARDRMIVRAAAWFEIAVGVSFLFALGAESQALFGGMPVGTGVVFARFSGIALVALGVACLPSGAGELRGSARALLLFNAMAAAFFAWVAMATAFRGYLLWPVVTTHAVIAISLSPQGLARRAPNNGSAGE